MKLIPHIKKKKRPNSHKKLSHGGDLHLHKLLAMFRRLLSWWQARLSTPQTLSLILIIFWMKISVNPQKDESSLYSNSAFHKRVTEVHLENVNTDWMPVLICVSLQFSFKLNPNIKTRESLNTYHINIIFPLWSNLELLPFKIFLSFPFHLFIVPYQIHGHHHQWYHHTARYSSASSWLPLGLYGIHSPR